VTTVVDLEQGASGAAARLRRAVDATLPATVALAGLVLVTGLALRVAGPPLLRHSATTAAVLLAGMGVPVRWAATGTFAGTVTIGRYPVLLLATFAIACATVGTGWTAGRRRPVPHPISETMRHALPGGAVFALSVTAMAAATSAGGLHVAGVDVRLSVPWVQALALSLLWAWAGMSAGLLLSRRRGAGGPPVPIGVRRFFRVPAVAAVLAAGVLVVLGPLTATRSALTSAGAPRGGTQPATTEPSDTTTSVPVTATSTAPTSSAARTPAAAAGASHRSTTSSGRVQSAAAAQAANNAGPAFPFAAPGVYRFDTSGSTSSLLGTKSFPAVTTLTVDPPSGTRQHSKRELVASNGDGFVIEQTLDYQPGGIAVVQQRLALTQSGNRTVRTLTAAPATIVLPAGLPAGHHSDFSLTGSTIAGHEVADLTTASPVDVGGRAVSTVLLKTVLTVTGNVSGTIELDQWWSPSSRVPMKEHLTGAMKSGLVTVRTHYDATVRNAAPG
jgi:hypothetical protein